MIYLNKEEIKSKYGASAATGGFSRFNADSCTRHKNAAYNYEFGYIGGFCVYVIIQKVSGARIAIVERQSLLALNGKGDWKVLEGDEANNRSISFQFTPPKEEVKFPSPLFASHQKQRMQLVIFHPKWQVDLSQVESSPI